MPEAKEYPNKTNIWINIEFYIILIIMSIKFMWIL